MPTWAAILIGILGGMGGLGGVFVFAQFLIERKDKKKKDEDEISQKLDQIIRENEETKLTLTRLQLLNLIQHEGSQHELMLVAEAYFKEMHGDWYMTPIFCRWLQAHKIEKPVWFNSEHNVQK